MTLEHARAVMRSVGQMPFDIDRPRMVGEVIDAAIHDHDPCARAAVEEFLRKNGHRPADFFPDLARSQPEPMP